MSKEVDVDKRSLIIDSVVDKGKRVNAIDEFCRVKELKDELEGRLKELSRTIINEENLKVGDYIEGKTHKVTLRERATIILDAEKVHKKMDDLENFLKVVKVQNGKVDEFMSAEEKDRCIGDTKIATFLVATRKDNK